MLNIIALIATVLCGLISVRCASKFCRNRPKDFSIFSLYALSWSLLLPYYGDIALKQDPAREIFPAFAAFVAVYIGGILRRSRHHVSGEEDTVNTVDVWSLWMLALFLVPELFTNPPVEQPLFDLGKVGMHLFEWWSIFTGMRALYMNQSQWLWILLGVPYAVLDILYGLWQLHIRADAPMGDFFLLGFAVSKIIYFPVFCWMVLQKNSPEFHRLNTREKCQELLPLGFLWKNIMNHHSA